MTKHSQYMTKHSQYMTKKNPKPPINTSFLRAVSSLSLLKKKKKIYKHVCVSVHAFFSILFNLIIFLKDKKDI